MVEGGQERPLMGFSEFFPFSLHGHVGGPITFQSTLRRYVSPAYYPISNRLCDDYWYKHCTQLYQSSCKQRSDCKLPWEISGDKPELSTWETGNHTLYLPVT